MKYCHARIVVISLITFLLATSCQKVGQQKALSSPPLTGTWKLLTGTIIQGKDTTITNYTINQELIKIINETHFAFLRHDLGEDSTTIFVSGGGRCKIDDKNYTEHLDFCNYREWENNTFEFEYKITGDTLTTIGREKIDDLGINQLNIEQYLRVK